MFNFNSKRTLGFLTVGMILLLGLLAVLQYYWLGQLSESELARMKSNLRLSASRFATDFDDQISRLHRSFLQPDAAQEPLEGIRKGYLDWLTGNPNSALVKSLYYVTDANDKQFELYQYDKAGNLLNALTWDPRLSFMKQRFDYESSKPGEPVKNKMIFFRGAPLDHFPFIALTLSPIGKFTRLPFETPAQEHIVVELDEAYFRDNFLPQLVEKHFPFQQADDIYLAIVNATTRQILFSNEPFAFDVIATPDISSKIAQIQMSNVLMFTVGDTLPSKRIHSVTRIVESNMDVKSGLFIKRDSMNIEWANQTEPLWELRIKHRSGSLESAVAQVRQRNLVISAVILFILAGSVLLLVLATRKEQRLALQQMEFVSGVSHELKTPLAVMRSAGDNLADGVIHSAEQIQAYGKLVSRESQRLTMMVEQVLEFAGIQSHENRFIMADVPLYEIIEETLLELKPEIAERRIQLKNNISGYSAVIRADRQAIKTGLRNILNNAIKYSHAGGTVELWASDAKIGSHKAKALYIRDYGNGIFREDLPHIFEAFYRAQNVRDAQIHGNGLGLNLTKKIIDAHHGQISVESDAGKGSTFSIILPII